MKQFDYLFNKLFQHIIKYTVVRFHGGVHAAVCGELTWENKLNKIVYRHNQNHTIVQKASLGRSRPISSIFWSHACFCD